MSCERMPRRSPRITEIRLIEVAGISLGGTDFLVPSHTLRLSRYGAKIHCEQALGPDQEISIYHPETGENCLAKVIGLYDRRAGGYCYGIEFLDPDHDFWNFAFRLASKVDAENITVEQSAPRTGNAAAPSKPAEPPRAESSEGTIRGKAMEVANTLHGSQSEHPGEICETMKWVPAAPVHRTRRVGRHNRVNQQRESRSQKAIRVRVSGTDRRGYPFSQTTKSMDVSRSGARLQGVGFLTVPGEMIEVKRGWKKARFRVVWVGRRGTKRADQAGIQCLEPEKNIWGIH